MKVLFVVPHVGRQRPESREYVRTWQMKPLMIATLKGLTPPDVECLFHDQRIDPVINYDHYLDVDLVAITCETFTAKSAYEAANEFRKRGLSVILGGYHPTLMPHEAELFADSVLVGYAESLWPEILKDARSNKLKKRYVQSAFEPYTFKLPDRSIYQSGLSTGSRIRKSTYVDIELVETGRGCPHSCEFCTIAAATNSFYLPRPIDMVLADLESVTSKTVFFVDDNLLGNPKHALELFKALKGMNIRWVSQGTLTMARNKKLLKAMAESGCMGMLIGFESFREDQLALMGKGFNARLGNYRELVDVIHEHGIALYGTFIHGYGDETRESILKTAEEAGKLNLFIAAFNHLMPFPGTPEYRRLKNENRLTDNEWWLSPSYRFGQAPFNPENLTSDDLHQTTVEARKRFYSIPSIAKRGWNNKKGNLTKPVKSFLYGLINLMVREEITTKNMRPLGTKTVRPIPFEKPKDDKEVVGV